MPFFLTKNFLEFSDIYNYCCSSNIALLLRFLVVGKNGFFNSTPINTKASTSSISPVHNFYIQKKINLFEKMLKFNYKKNIKPVFL